MNATVRRERNSGILVAGGYVGRCTLEEAPAAHRRPMPCLTCMSRARNSWLVLCGVLLLSTQHSRLTSQLLSA